MAMIISSWDYEACCVKLTGSSVHDSSLMSPEAVIVEKKIPKLHAVCVFGGTQVCPN